MYKTTRSKYDRNRPSAVWMRKWRAEAKMSCACLGSAIGRSSAWVSDVERGVFLILPDLVPQIRGVFRAFGVHADMPPKGALGNPHMSRSKADLPKIEESEDSISTHSLLRDGYLISGVRAAGPETYIGGF